MADKINVIPRLDDQTVLRLFRDIDEKYPAQNFSLYIMGLDPINFRDAPAERSRLVEAVDVPGSYLVSQVGVHYNGFSVQFFRGCEPGRIPTSPYTDEIKVAGSGSAFGEADRLSVISMLNGVFDAKIIGSAGPGPVSSIDQLAEVYQSTVLKLETKFAEQIENISSWTVEQAAAYEKRKLALAEETQIERAALQLNFDQRDAALKHQATELDELRKKLDDRDYMHVRRAIRGELQEIVKAREEKFTLTSNTRQLRGPVHLAMMLLLLFLLALNGIFLWQLMGVDVGNASIAVLAWVFAKQGLAAIAFIGSIYYYVRWMNRWFEQHAAAEFLLKQFQLDIDRASWVVETALEWRRDQQSEIPAPLLEGISRNLFVDRDRDTEKTSAADDLASALVGNASAVKLKVGENEVSIDRKGLSGLAKTPA
ncbi:hypothetical protein AB8B21_12325 [Tardiphaga sp. 866_E4_N2_1]|jgi:ABC-type multidrug transport system fused ATPase/permease subunit|uniref:hypothetical protein n=1 Tax=unclassified Tardiphaga TaxID=2631404 RepID=UPI003F277645